MQNHISFKLRAQISIFICFSCSTFCNNNKNNNNANVHFNLLWKSKQTTLLEMLMLYANFEPRSASNNMPYLPKKKKLKFVRYHVVSSNAVQKFAVFFYHPRKEIRRTRLKIKRFGNDSIVFEKWWSFFFFFFFIKPIKSCDYRAKVCIQLNIYLYNVLQTHIVLHCIPLAKYAACGMMSLAHTIRCDYIISAKINKTIFV